MGPEHHESVGQQGADFWAFLCWVSNSGSKTLPKRIRYIHSRGGGFGATIEKTDEKKVVVGIKSN